MNEIKLGLNFLRKCKEEEEKLIKDQFSDVEHMFKENPSPQIYWVNIYKNKQFCFKKDQKIEEFKKWVEELVQQAQNGKKFQIASFGFVNNPKGNQKNQSYHYDYHLSFKHLFIPMTYLVSENSTQYLTQHVKCQPYPKTQRYAWSDKQLLERDGSDYLVVSQVISKPYVILKLEAETVHRGIRNSGEQDRYMFYIGYAAEQVTIKEKQIHMEKITMGMNKA